jgi:hypothetical protein
MIWPVRLIAVAAMAGMLAQPVLSFQESTQGGGEKAAPPAAAVLEPPAAPAAAPPAKGLNLKMPPMSIGQGTGTEVRIPGFGKVGVLPKLDFGLELLYGATEGQGRPEEKSEPSDVQIRGTLKHRF